jgi:hypothetical protein
MILKFTNWILMLRSHSYWIILMCFVVDLRWNAGQRRLNKLSWYSSHSQIYGNMYIYPLTKIHKIQIKFRIPFKAVFILRIFISPYEISHVTKTSETIVRSIVRTRKLPCLLLWCMKKRRSILLKCTQLFHGNLYDINHKPRWIRSPCITRRGVSRIYCIW